MKTIFLVLSIALSFFATAAMFAQQPTSNKPIVIGHPPPGHKAIFLPQPEYPSSAAYVGIEGPVKVAVTVNEAGKVVEATVNSGHPFFHANSLKAAWQARFKPVLLGGQPVGFRTLIVFNFTKSIARNVQKIGIVNGRARNLQKPEYPKEAEEFCVDGDVGVHVKISKAGKVLSATGVEGDELLQAAAIESAKTAQFNPTPYPQIETEGILVYNFRPVSKCITSGVVNSRARHLPRPEVGNILHRQHLRLGEPATVEVQIIVNQNGEVSAARAISGHPLLQTACVLAAKGAKFTPVPHANLRVRALLVYRIHPDGSVEM